jgi:hypothetical protein
LPLKPMYSNYYLPLKFSNQHFSHRVVLKVSTFWNIPPCSPCMNQHFGKTCHFNLQGRKQSSKKPTC